MFIGDISIVFMGSYSVYNWGGTTLHHLGSSAGARIQLPPGPVTLTFRATGLGLGVASGGACLTLRLDLEISSHQARKIWEDLGRSGIEDGG